MASANVQGGGLSNDALNQSFTMEDSMDDAGYVLMKGTAAGKMKKCTQGNAPWAIGLASTEDALTGVAGTNVLRGATALREGNEEYLQLPATHAAIAYGDPLCISATAGTVTKRDGTTFNDPQIAVALEAKAQDAAGPIKCRITRAMLGKHEIYIPLVVEKQEKSTASLSTMNGYYVWDPAKWDLTKIGKIEVEMEYNAPASTSDSQIDLYDVTNTTKVADVLTLTTAVAHTATRADVTAAMKALAATILGCQYIGDGTRTFSVYKVGLVITYREN